MADTKADIILVDGDWVDAYALTGIAVGTTLVIQNKSSDDILIHLSASKPTSSSINGTLVPPFIEATVDASESGCWVKGTVGGRVSVQEG